MSSHTMHGKQVGMRKGHGLIEGKKKSVYFWSFGVRLRRCEKRHLRKYGQLSRRDSWVGVRVCKWACLLVVVFERHKNQQSATWVREPRPALELREKQRNEGREWNGWNGDADGHTLHLGPSPKVNNVQGAIWLRLEAEEGVGERWAEEGSVGE